MTPRNRFWPPHRPPLAIDPRHFKSRAEIEAYLGEARLRCLICGRRFGKLGVHVTRTHHMPVAEYNEMFGLPRKTTLVGVGTKEKLQANAEAMGFPDLGREMLKIYRPANKGDKRRARTASAELLRLRDAALSRPRRGNRWCKPPR